MTLEILEKNLIFARKRGSIFEKEVLLSAINAVKNAAIAKGCKDNITEQLVNEVLLKEKKILQEQIDSCPEDRVLLKAEYLDKMSYLDKYCPKILNNIVEIKNIIYSFLGAAGIEDDRLSYKEAVKLLMPEFKGKADMRIVNQAIKEIFDRKD